MSDFDRAQVQVDLETLREVFTQFFDGVRAEDWNRKTGTREKDWTLLETTAHVVSVAQAFNHTVRAGQQNKPLEPDITQREDVRDWNARMIPRLTVAHAPAQLVSILDAELAGAASLTATLSDDALDTLVHFPVYNRPAPLKNFLMWQLTHAGVVHGAQLTRALDQAPLWERYGPPMSGRQAGRFMRQFSWAYWPTHAPPGLTKTFHMQAGGEHGGDWTLVAAPDGGSVADGAPPDPDFVMWFANPELMFSLFTMNVTFVDAMKRKELRIEHGETRELMSVLSLFAATPPAS